LISSDLKPIFPKYNIENNDIVIFVLARSEPCSHRLRYRDERFLLKPFLEKSVDTPLVFTIRIRIAWLMIEDEYMERTIKCSWCEKCSPGRNETGHTMAIVGMVGSGVT
jgi:hypothetical protein